MAESGLGWTLLSVGGLMVYSGFKGFSVLKVVENVITGKPLNDAALNEHPLGYEGVPPAQPQVVDPQQVPGSSGTNQSASGVTAQNNQNLGKIFAKDYGWDEGVQWDSLVWLWTKESDWDNHALNRSSGAYGIPQALPYTKMPKDAWPESAGGSSNPAAQIKWGLEYIAGRYGLPQFAKAFHITNGWY